MCTSVCRLFIKGVVVFWLEWIPRQCLWNQGGSFTGKHTLKGPSLSRTHTQLCSAGGKKRTTSPVSFTRLFSLHPLASLLPSLMRPMWCHKHWDIITTSQIGFHVQLSHAAGPLPDSSVWREIVFIYSIVSFSQKVFPQKTFFHTLGYRNLSFYILMWKLRMQLFWTCIIVKQNSTCTTKVWPEAGNATKTKSLVSDFWSRSIIALTKKALNEHQPEESVASTWTTH